MAAMAATTAVGQAVALRKAESSKASPLLREGDASAFFGTHNLNLLKGQGVSRLRCNTKSRIVTSAVPDQAGEYPAEKPPTPLLDTINYPIHMKNLTVRVCVAHWD